MRQVTQIAPHQGGSRAGWPATCCRRTDMTTNREIARAGFIAGGLLAPLTASLSWLRRSRMFHPVGVSCWATVRGIHGEGPAGVLAARLPDRALLRFSGAWWKRRELPDVLGCAIRLAYDPVHERPRPADQDLLFATIRRPWTTPFAPLSTDQHDYLANDYYAVSPFDFPGLERVELRVTPDAPSPGGADRDGRLVAAIDAKAASLLLSWAPYAGAFRRPEPKRFSPLARLTIVGVTSLDDEALRFDPFQAGLGIEPVGFVHAMRALAYRASQRARPGAVNGSES